MNGHRGLLLLTLPLLAGSGLLVALHRRPEPERALLPPRKSKRPVHGAAAEVSGAAVGALASPTPPARDMGEAVSTSRIRSAYKGYRTAVANENKAVQDALLPVLRRDRETALLYARDELARAATEQDKTVARRTLDALER